MNLCVIPARGGSKRIPKKNIKDFLGKPLIAYSIQTALSSKIFDEVIVSTDDKDIADVAIKFGAKVPFFRDEKLSDDYASSVDVVIDAIKKMDERYQNICCLYATAPLLKYQILMKAYDEFISSNSNFLFSVCEFSYPIQRALMLDENKSVSMFYPEYFNSRSQDLQKSYHDAGQFYFGKREAWLDNKNIFKDNSKAFVLPYNLVCDIDTLQDFEFAQKLYQINAI
ncbi:pseudaminic acid cytidylyltransferase [Campylobacter pinnipediorum]|uniref:pseudaminic acid cytidylyltransferase n=1 Tax=Campylobacter pinnipediorum TaxID=1965231 RepID=UPI00084D1CF2|nr:pseudaminic acid cytidylyltransferase [Campylobacter pinnipediorum]AQW80481.1 CMP-pseudaminic acid synthetase [Campylobacter pinnipediorum subsp. pinnipediorum]AQW83828.1 CMP-pseudaminic acid synthetase [Campylobacter pinnipediorum subsp. pinnipediorum]